MKTAKLFKNGQSQAVRLPKEFRIAGAEVYIIRRGKAVILLPKDNFWDPLLETIGEFSSDFMAKREELRWDKRLDPFKPSSD